MRQEKIEIFHVYRGLIHTNFQHQHKLMSFSDNLGVIRFVEPMCNCLNVYIEAPRNSTERLAKLVTWTLKWTQLALRNRRFYPVSSTD